MRASLRHGYLLLLAILTSGCQVSPGSRALESRFGGAMRRLVEAPAKMFASETRRGRRLLSAANPSRFFRAAELNELVAAVRYTGAPILSNLRRLPYKLRQPTGPILRRVGRDLRALVGDEHSGIRRRNRVAPLLNKLRQSLRRIPSLLRLRQPILAGPGDLDRSADPFQVGRGRSWVERLLMRF